MNPNEPIIQNARNLVQGQGASQLPQDIGLQNDTEQTWMKRTNNMPLTNRIKGGTSRDVYDLGNGMVVKIAKSPKGLEQNDYEHDYFLEEGGFRPKSIERGKDYAVMEKAERNDKLAREFLKPLQKFSPVDYDNKTGELQDAMNKMGLNDFMDYDLLWNDFKAHRNWGFINGHPVLTDGGALTQSVTSSSQPSEIAQRDWRDILNERKQIKKQLTNTPQVINSAQFLMS